nr:DUF1272 domain-containing protein [Henriciella sp.]
MRPSCESCDRDLPPDEAGAVICSFECTFCQACASGVHEGVCPNCGGGFCERPRRKGPALKRFPASARRIYKGRPQD